MNSSVFALEKVSLPTGGYISYEYEKARRTYAWSNSGYIETDWCETYKISKVSDSSQFSRTYEYENDQSGYPYGRLDVAMIDSGGGTYSTGNETGYIISTSGISSENIYYYCIMRQNGATTITTFDYKHNKVREETCSGNANASSRIYTAGKGTSTKQAIIGNYIYHMGDNHDIHMNSSEYFYRQNISTGEVVILKSYENFIPSGAIMRSSGGFIYMFYKTGYGSTSDPCRLVAKSYNPSIDTWADAGEYVFSDSTYGQHFNLNQMYFYGDTFYSYTLYNNSLYHVKYSPNIDGINGTWSYDMDSISSSRITYICQKWGSVYYNSGKNIYEYDLFTGDLSSPKSFSALSSSGMNGGFTVGTRTFLFDDDLIREFDFYAGTTGEAIRYDASSAFEDLYYNDYIIQKGTDDNIYYVAKATLSTGLRPIYRFDYNKFTLVSNRLINNTISTIIAGTDCLYLVSDGVETVSLNQWASTSHSVSRTTYDYNTYNQLISSTTTRVNLAQTQDGGTQSQTYVGNKSVLSSYTDIWGNRTEYQYADSIYYIPTQITQYANRTAAEQVITTNTLTSDKTKIDYTETVYSDRTIKTDYVYECPARPGNMTRTIVSEIKDGSETVVSDTAYSYTYTDDTDTDLDVDTNGTLVTSVTSKDIVTNNPDFTTGTAHDISVSYAYNILGLVHRETDALGRSTYYGYNKNGWNTWKVNPDNTTVDILYTLQGANNGENTIKTTYNEQYIVTNYYDDLGRLVTQTEKAPLGEEMILTKYWYDGHNVSKTQDSIGNSTCYEYDSFDRVTDLSQYDVENNKLSHYYIIFNDYSLIRTASIFGKYEQTYYDNAGRVIHSSTASRNETYTYDYMGNVNKVKSGNNEETEYLYNNLGLLEKVIDPLDHETEYTYDALGNVKTVESAGTLMTTNTYDRLNRILTSTDAMGMTGYFAYDDGGRVVASKDRNEQTMTYSYKPNTNYLASKTVGDLSLSYTYDDFGNVLTATNEAGTTGYSYKFNNLLETITTPDNKTITYHYDNNKNMTEVEDYAGSKTVYGYDGANRIDTITRNGSLVADYDYYIYGSLLEKVTYPGQGSSAYEYGYANNIELVENRLADGTLVNYYYYEYDQNRNQTRKYEIVSEDMSIEERITDYTYDALSRLTSVSEPDGTVTGYTFDAKNNIMTKSVVHPADYTYSFKQEGTDYTMSQISAHNSNYVYDANNRLVQENEYISGAGEDYSGILEVQKMSDYDANGNLLRTQTGGQIDEQVVQYSYNQWNQMTQYQDAEANVISYAYDATGARTSKTQNGAITKYYWDRGYISSEAVGNNFTASNYIGVQGIFARQSGATTSYMIKNGHGDVTALVSGGAVTKTYDYDAYGVEKNIDADDANPFRYCGEYTDLSSGLIYLRNRYYDPATSRMLSEDPIRSGTNWYTYCGNNPIMFVDPLGLEQIVVSGSEYDDGRYKYNFIEPAIKKIAELKANAGDEQVTWVVSTTGYSDDAIAKFQEVADYYGVTLVKIGSAAELQNYINSKSTSQWELSENRTGDKITKFALFSHGVVGSVELGYNQENRSQLSLDSNWVGGLFSNAFDNPNSAFYSCNTGTGGNNSFAQKWVNVTGGRTWAAAGTTYYGNMNIGESLMDKLDRRHTGFNPYGSRHYPVASDGVSFYNFYRQ